MWAAHSDGSGAWLADFADITSAPGAGGGRGGGPELSPDGKYIFMYRRTVRRLYRARTARSATASVDTGGAPFIKEWGRQSNPQWSPDGSKLAFVSTRDNHAFIGVYDMKSHKVDYVAESVDFDGSPTWSADGKKIAFIRRPGTPFGQQAQQGQGGIGNPWGRRQSSRRAQRAADAEMVAAVEDEATAAAAVVEDAAVTTRRRRAPIPVAASYGATRGMKNFDKCQAFLIQVSK